MIRLGIDFFWDEMEEHHYLGLFQARVDAWLKITQIAKDPLFEFFHVPHWTTECLQGKK